MQAKLDKHILEKHNLNIMKRITQTNPITHIEISELANADVLNTGAKDSESDERLLDELADMALLF